jgi:succinate dehydrogenase / fumarate reductase flavoprotein subunit/fumarate reductase flavoprotein subunit
MEMMQFHPTGLLAGDSMLTGTVLEEGLRGAGGHLRNALDERYMQRYDPAKMERSTRDRVSRSSFLEVRAGRGTADNGVYLDVRHLGKEFLLKSSPGMYRRCLSIGVDMAKDLIPVTPTAHFQMGGVRIDTQCRASIDGLFAAGEDAGGVHGANRLGGNGVAESMVFGALAGRSIAEYAAGSDRAPRVDLKAAERLAETVTRARAGSGDAFELRAKVRDLAWQHLGIIRSAESLRAAEAALSEFGDEVAKLAVPADRAANAVLHEKLDAENLICIARLIRASAALRPESRGSHYREDFPEQNASLLMNIVLRAAPDGSLADELVPVRFTRRKPEDLQGETLIPSEQVKPSASVFTSEVN